MYVIKEINNIKELESLRSDWDKAVRQNNNCTIFQDIDFIITWFKYFGEKLQCRILCVYDNSLGEYIGFIPLYININNGLKHVRMIGERHADYSHIILESNLELTHLVSEYLRNKMVWDVIYLNSYCEGSLTDLVINAITSNSFFHQSEKRASFHILKLKNTWEEYYNQLGKKFRQDTERQIKRLNKLGNYSIEEIKSENIINNLDSLFELHKRRWSAKDGKTLFDDKNTRDFFIELAVIFDSCGYLRFSKMVLGTEILAMHFGFTFQNRFYYYIPVINDSYSQYSAGRLLLLELIKNSFDDGLEIFDLMAGDESYKSMFGGESKILLKSYIFPKTIKGKILSIIKKLT